MNEWTNKKHYELWNHGRFSNAVARKNEWKWITFKQAVKQAGTSHFVAIVHNLISVEKLIYKWKWQCEHPPN